MSGRRADRARAASEKIYEVLLLAYPEEFRREYGPRTWLRRSGTFCVGRSGGVESSY